jgi:hypothetical protein
MRLQTYCSRKHETPDPLCSTRQQSLILTHLGPNDSILKSYNKNYYALESQNHMQNALNENLLQVTTYSEMKEPDSLKKGKQPTAHLNLYPGHMGI